MHAGIAIDLPQLKITNILVGFWTHQEKTQPQVKVE